MPKQEDSLLEGITPKDRIYNIKQGDLDVDLVTLEKYNELKKEFVEVNEQIKKLEAKIESEGKILYENMRNREVFLEKWIKKHEQVLKDDFGIIYLLECLAERIDMKDRVDFFKSCTKLKKQLSSGAKDCDNCLNSNCIGQIDESLGECPKEK